MRVTGLSPNLVNGVSQQAPALRLPSQLDIQENAYSTTVEGLKKRPPTEFIAKVLTTIPDNAFVHIINRDSVERYIVIITASSIQVYDFNGNAKTVTTPDGLGYLSSASNPYSDLKAVTIADYTFIVNTKMKVLANTTTFATRPYEALFSVNTGQPGRVYRMYINGTLAADFLIGNQNGAQQDTSLIAKALTDSTGYATNATPEGDTMGSTVSFASIGTGLKQRSYINGSGGWTITQINNTIYMSSTTDFSVKINDGFNNQAMHVAKGYVTNFADLPSYAPDGVTFEVKQGSTNNSSSYWVQYVASTTSGPGQWKEVPKPGVSVGLDYTTMPFNLVRNADGTFTFRKASWNNRKAGDTTLSPDPSFTNGYINNIFFHRNRLGFLSDENVIMSRSGSFFDFYRTSAAVLMDDDPIDVSTTHVKVSVLKNAIPYQDYLFLFSDQTQFRLQATDSLTPKTVSIKPMTEYFAVGSAPPVGVGNKVFFNFDRNNYAGIRDFTIDRYTQLADSYEITEHIPTYIPSNIRKIGGSSNESFIACVSNTDLTKIYVYKFAFDGDQRVQSSWSVWPMDGKIVGFEFIDNYIYVVITRGSVTTIERINIQPNALDSEFGFMVNLDRKVRSTSGTVTSVYNSGTLQTTFTLPWATSASTRAVTFAASGPYPLGAELPIVSYTGNTIVVSGDARTWSLIFGQLYTTTVRLSRLYRREQTGNGGSLAVEEGRLQLHHVTLSFDRTAYFRVVVNNEGHDTKTYEYNGRRVDAPDNLVDVIPVNAGKLSVPLFGRTDNVTIDIINDTWLPMSFITLNWVGNWSQLQRYA